MGSLDNLMCPQFVDFTSDECNNLYDGADFAFENQVVGEAGIFDAFDSSTAKLQSVELNILSNATNFNHDSKEIQVIKTGDTNNKLLAKIDKENEMINKNNIVGETKDIVSSAIELINSTNKSNQNDKSSVSKLPTPVANKNKPPQLHQRNPSNASSISKSSSINNLMFNGPTHQVVSHKMAQYNKQAAPYSTPYNNQNKNIVTKTLAKVSAAFKTSNKPATTITTATNSIDTLKKKLTSKKPSKIAPNSVGTNLPLRVDYATLKITSNESEYNEEQSNRRCSSVPRTLKEKQALNRAGVLTDLNEIDQLTSSSQNLDNASSSSIKATLPTLTSTLGDKIHNFFNSHTAHNLIPTTTKNNNSNSATTKKMNFFGYYPKIKKEEPILPNIKISNASKSNKPLKPNNEISTTGTGHTYNHRSRSIEAAKVNINSENQVKKIAVHNSRKPTGDSFEVKLSSHNKQFNVSSNYSKGNLFKPTVATSPKLMTNNLKTRNRSAEKQTQAVYHGLRFLPKQQQLKYHQSSLDSPAIQPLSIYMGSNSSNDVKNIADQPLVNRSVPGKSASFRQVHSSKVSTFKSESISKNVHVINHQLTSNTDNSSSIVLESNRNNNLNESTSSSVKLNRSSANSSKFQFHTELRAQKRNENEQIVKEKERMANLIKRDLESERAKKQDEEIQKIRMIRNSRTKPTKKPVEVKALIQLPSCVDSKNSLIDSKNDSPTVNSIEESIKNLNI